MIDRLARQLTFFAPAAVLSAWGTVMLHTVEAGHINRLLSPMFRSYVLIAGVLLVILSVIYLVLYQPSEQTAPALAPTGRLRQLLRWMVLLVPVIAACVLSPAGLSASTFDNRQTLNSTTGVPGMPSMTQAEDDSVKAALAADPNQPVPVEVTDLTTLAQSPAQLKTFDGRKVRCVGIVISQAGSAPKLVRWIMWCCAADARPVSVDLSGTLTPGPYKDSQYYEIIGTAEFPSTLGQVVPRIKVESMKPTAEPDEPFLSP